MQDMATLLSGVASLLWPVVVAGLLMALLPSIRRIIESRSFSVKVAGAEITVQAATEQLQKQVSDLQQQVVQLLKRGEQPPGAGAGEALTAARAALREPSAEPAAGPRLVLWVDDHPTNNAIEVAHLADRGVHVVQAVATEDALQQLARHPEIGAVISDMGRTENGRYVSLAGIDLLKAIRGRGDNRPFLVYSSGRAANAHIRDIVAAGGDGATSSPVRLFTWLDEKLALPASR